MSTKTPEEKRARLKSLVKLGNLMDDWVMSDELIEKALDRIDFTRSDEENPAIIAHNRAIERAKTEEGDLVEIFGEEYRAALAARKPKAP